MGGSLPLAMQFHREGGQRGHMDATTGTPWALKTISRRTGHSWSMKLPMHGPPAPQKIVSSSVAKEPGLNPGGRQPPPPLYPLSHLSQGYGAQETTGPHKAT